MLQGSSWRGGFPAGLCWKLQHSPRGEGGRDERPQFTEAEEGGRKQRGGAKAVAHR